MIVLPQASEMNVSNSVFFGNSHFLPNPFNNVSVSHSLLEGPLSGDGVIHFDPNFVNAAAGNYRLQANSPCIDSGEIGFELDEDGSRTDMGAFPYSLNAIQFIRGDSNSDSQIDIADAIELLDFLFQGGSAPGCMAAVDLNSDSSVDISDAISVLAYLFTTGNDRDCLAACNTNGVGNIDIADAIYCLSFLTLGGAAPPAPFPACGGSLESCVDYLSCP